MVGNKVRLVVLSAIGWLTTANIGCDNATPIEPYTPDSAPPLTDAIPYEGLGHGTLVFHRTGPEGNSWGGVYVIDIDQQSSWGMGGPFYRSVVSPDGQQIAYTAYAGWEAGTAWDVHVMNIDGTDAQNVSNLEYQDRFPSWTPDGLKILFWVAGGNTDRIYIQSPVVNPTDRVVVSDTSVFLSLSGRVSASSTGGIAFVGQLGDSLLGLFTVDMDGNDAKLLVPSLSDFVSLESPAFSPDGQTIAYLSVTRDSAWSYQSIELLLIGTDGTNLTSVALVDADGQREWHNPGQRNAVSVCWSPDGSKLLFNRPEGDLVAHIYVINSDGSGLTRVTSAEGITDRSVSWSN